MIYLIYGNQTPSIKNRVKKIVKESLPESDEMNFVRFDGQNVLIQEAIDEANYVPLGYDHKVVVVENCYFLEKPKPKNKIESDQNYDSLLDYLENENPDCDLILTVGTLSVDANGDFYKLIKEKGKIVEIPDLDQNGWQDGVKKYCREILKLNIDNDALYELGERTNGDVALLQNSAAKLALYTDHITYEDVVLMVTRPLDDNSFLIFNYLIQGKNSDALKLFRDLRVNNVEPATLIGMLGNQFRLLSEIKYLLKEGNDVESVAKQLNIKVGRVHVLKKSIYLVSDAALKRTLDDLYNLDLQIKSGQVDRLYAFELFLINYKTK